jgi:hypothetical protein
MHMSEVTPILDRMHRDEPPAGNEDCRAQRGEGIYGVLGFELERDRRAT